MFDEFRCYFEAEKNGKSVAELKTIYKTLRTEYDDLPDVSIKSVMAESLKQYESSHPDECVLIPSEDEFYGISRGVNRIAPYVQWVFVPASKDITEECEESKGSALGQLLERTVRSKIDLPAKIDDLRKRVQTDYTSILSAEQDSLNDISASLEDRLKSWSRPGISAKVLWKQDSEKSVKLEEPWAYIKIGEQGFEGELHRFGHGLQRSYMLALLQELNESPDESAPTLIMAIEEPEIYQHPPQVRYLAETLHDLSKKKSQIITCSHHPLFVPGDNFEAIRIVRKENNPSTSFISQFKYRDLATILEAVGQKPIKEEGMLAKLYTNLNPTINEMFFCNVLILVEGIADVAYLLAYITLNDSLNDFRKYGCHIVPVGGKSKMIKPLGMAKLLKIPVFVVADADTDKSKDIELHKKDNKAIQSLLEFANIDEWPDNDIFSENFVMWKTNMCEVLREELGRPWDDCRERSATDYGTPPGGLKKNPMAIARSLELAWEDDVKSELLLRLVNNIIEFAENNT